MQYLAFVYNKLMFGSRINDQDKDSLLGHAVFTLLSSLLLRSLMESDKP